MKDPTGFAEFVAVRSTALTRLGCLLTGDRQYAEDLVQAALLKVAQRWGRIDDPAAYIRRVMVNDSRTWWRRMRMREHLVEQVPEPGGGEDAAEAVVRRTVLMRAMRQLPPR